MGNSARFISSRPIKSGEFADVLAFRDSSEFHFRSLTQREATTPALLL